jgi:uncharacterized damage-inducible protein DinB
MQKLLMAALITAPAWAQSAAPADPMVASSKRVFEIAKYDILRTAEMVPADKYDYKPVDGVRTMGQLLAHVADGQYEFCGPVKEGRMVRKNVEKSATTKEAITRALNEAFAYCEAAYAGMTDASAAQMVNLFGMKMTRLGAMDFNTAHTFEHYGNLVTYLRMNKMVPPSSQPRK